MAKQLNVSLAFTTDTREAKAQLQDLQNQLNNIIKMPSNKLGITDDIREAISATAELSSRLQQATNINTGNLDFSKFNNSLKQSGQSLSSYGQQLQKLGPTGQQAFLTLTKSIATAEVPIKRTNALVREFTTTLANTARWQISSSVLHGLMGSMQSAYRYAQDLNESLNDIRIVTGQSVDQMARFAAEANAAAKALSATTVEYTNASLIYYQQGLSDQQVKERTDITIKMANVSKQSAEVVSDQMTAVWNNFYNGSKSLEYYADVMTALGAATASSADEIAGGLEKFAAIGETIGLSYEYAAAALATITSNTRQSEEVVGTALKTIFARIQGLNLGETLEDGTTLNKYSSALEKVGISIFDSAGELKKMDTILDEMGSKWETLNKAQQTALAQTVAGTRQYTQLVALMDNWDKGDSDSMKANLSTAYGSSGALQEQADIYAESWEAARDRVTAAAEKIYSALLDDDFFIEMLNGFEKILTFVSQLIDNLGGLRGVLLALGAIVTKVFSAQISQGLTNMAYNIKMMTKSGRESVEKERRDFIDNAVNSIPQSDEYTTDVEMAQQDSLRTELTLQSEYMAKAEQMSAIEAETNKRLIERTRILKDQTVELEKQKQAVKERVSNKVMDLRGDVGLENLSNPDVKPVNFDKQVQPQIEKIRNAFKFQDILKDMSALEGRGGEVFVKLRTEMNKVSKSGMSKEIKELISDINQLGDTPDPEQLKTKMAALNLELDKTVKIGKSNIKGVVPDDAGKKVDALTQDLKEQATVERNLAQAKKESAQAQEMATNSIKNAKGAQKQWSDVMVESANVAFSVASAISMVNSAIDTLKNPDVSGMQKLLTVITTMSMVLPTIISLVGTMKKLFSSETIAKIANAAATWAQVAAEKKLNEEKGTSNTKTRKNIKDTWQDTKNKLGQKGKNIKDQWNESALEKRASTKGSGYTKHKNGMYSVKGQKGFVSADQAGKMAGKEALKAVGTKAASVGIAAAGIAVIIGTVAMVVNQLNKAEKAVEKAKAAAQSLSENYDNVKASYDNFINAQSGYETATASMEELTKGTVAYQEALMQANEAAGELLATNKNLKYTIEDGKIVIDEDSLEQAKADELKKVEIAQAAKIAGQRELSEAETELKKRDAARAMKSGSDGWQKTGNAAAGGVLGAVGAGLAAGGIAGAVGGGGVFSVPAAIIGAVVGGVAGLVTGIVQETSTKTEQEAFDALAEKAEADEDFLARLKAGEVSEEEFKSIGIEDERLIASLQQNGEQVAELVGEMAANTAAINAQNDLVAANALADNEAVQDSEYKDQIIDIAGDAYGHAYDKAMESEWVDSWGKDGISKANGANKEAKKVFEEYLKYAGLEGQGYELTDTTGTDKNRQFVYKDKEGNEHKVSLEAMQAARAAYEASETLDNSATKLAETFDKLANSSNEADQALLSFVSGKNFEGASKGELEDIQSEVGDIGYNAETGEYDSSKVKTYLESSLGETLTDDVAIRYGYESADAMMDAFAKQLHNADIAWDSIKVPDNFKFADDMSLGTAKALESQIEKMNLGPPGEQAGEDYVNGLNSMLEGIKGEDQQAALAELTAIDWSDWNAMEKAEEILASYGKEIDSTSSEWLVFIDTMRKANLAQPDFSQIKADLNEVSAILDKLDFGSVISEEDYQRLVQYNDEWERFFMLQADGTRKFIGDSDAMKQETRDNIIAQKQEMAERQKAQEGMDNAGWNVNGEEVDWYKSGEQFSYAGSAKNLMDTSDTSSTGQVLAKLGYTDDVIQGMIEDYNKAVESGDEEAIKKAEERFEAMYNGIGDFMGEDFEANQAELDEMMASTATSIEELNQLWTSGAVETEEAYLKQYEALINQSIQSAENLSQLQDAIAQSGGQANQKLVDQKLIELGKAYENCSDEVKAFEAALLSNDQALIEEARSMLEVAIELNELAEKYDLDAEATANYADRLADGKATTAEAKRAFGQMAIAAQRLDRGVKNLNENLEDYKKVIKTANRNSFEWSQTMDDLKDSIADVFNVADGNMFSDTFAEGLLDSKDFEKALQGDIEALDRLRASATVDIGDNIIASLGDQANVLQTEYRNAAGEIVSASYTAQSAWDYVRGVLADGFTLEEINDEQFVESLNQMIQASGMTKEQIQSMLGSMGVSAEVVTDYKYMETEVPTYDEVSVPNGYDTFWGKDPDGNEVQYTRPRIKKITIPGKPEKVMGYVPTYSLKTTSGDVSSGGEIDYSNTFSKASPPSISPSSTNAGKDTGGGGGSTNAPSKGDKTHKSEVVERYKEVTDVISKLGREMEKLENSQDELWGKDRLNNIQDQIDLIDEETAALERQRDEAAAYMAQDASEIASLGRELGVSFTIEDGYITDYEDVMSQLYNDLAQAEATYQSYYDRSEGASDETKNKLAEEQAAYEETVLQPLRDQLALLEEALGRYDESAEKFRESEDALEEKERKKRALQFQKWSEQLELEISFDEGDLALFEHLIEVLGDNFYKLAEALAYMVGSLENLQNGQFGGQMQSYINSLETYNQQYQELESLKAQGKISDADYIAGLEEIKNGMMSNVAALAELDDQMVHYYGDTLEAAMDELSAYTDMIEHSNTVLDHYSNILEILGKSNDYKKMGAILKGQASVAKNQADVSAAWYENRKRDAEEQARIYAEQKALYDQGLISEEVLKGYEQKWIDAQTAANEAQDQMLSDAAAWAEALRAVVENELKDLGQTLENNLTRGYGSFDAMMTAMDRANSLQEEYLTTTNQIYETNKMMRTAQQEIDKTSNTVAKRRLKNFIEQTSALQNQTKLSKYELDIQQAKYELLLAEIALEEAQNTKSTVRLQRDNAGNFGYVYTADQSQILEAQQKLEDAQNKLYNIGLDGANDYSQKYAETMQEMYDTLTSIQEAWLNGEFETQAEYNEAMTQAQEYYYQKLQDYSSLYQIAVTTDSRIVKEAWSSDFGEMTYNTEQWKSDVSNYVSGVKTAFEQWQSSIAGIESLVGTSLTEIQGNVSTLTTNSQSLADTTVNSVIPALENEISSVHNLTDEYLGLRQSILDVINEYNLMIQTINGVPRSTYENQEGSGGGTPTDPDEGNPGSGNPSGGTPPSNTPNDNEDKKNNARKIAEEAAEIIQKVHNGTIKQTSAGWVPSARSAGYSENAISIARQAFNDSKAGGGYSYCYEKALKLVGLDTGGYTGEWGSYGKLAVLHEKELVLNQQQTADLLSTMEFLDKILQTLDLQAMSSQLGGILSSPTFGQFGGEVLEQNVHIEASFPAVQDRNEIEEAFNNLINQASQYANRK